MNLYISLFLYKSALIENVQNSTQGADAFRQVPLFAKLTDEHLDSIAQGTDVWLQPGDRVATEGDPPDNFYLLLEGQVEWTRKVGQQDVYVVTYQAVTFWGHEPILLDSAPTRNGKVPLFVAILLQSLI